MAIDEQKLEEAVGKVFGELAVAATGPLDGVTGRLQAGGTVADIGCGQGTSTIMMAERFPASSFTGFDHSTMVCTPSSLAQPGATALGAMAGETRIRQVLADAGYTGVRRVAAEAAPFNVVLEARP